MAGQGVLKNESLEPDLDDLHVILQSRPLVEGNHCNEETRLLRSFVSKDHLRPGRGQVLRSLTNVTYLLQKYSESEACERVKKTV